MTDLADTLVTVGAAQQIVKALVSGLIDVAKKIPMLWRGADGCKEDVIRAEVEREPGRRPRCPSQGKRPDV